MGDWMLFAADADPLGVWTWSEVGRFLALVGGLVVILLVLIATIAVLANFDWDRLKLGPVCPRCGKRYREDPFDEVG